MTTLVSFVIEESGYFNTGSGFKIANGEILNWVFYSKFGSFVLLQRNWIR